MSRYTITDQAQADIREIISYIRQDSKQSAKKVRADFSTEMKRLAQFPESATTATIHPIHRFDSGRFIRS
jgi:plasmid stabilization system protein ParE